MSNDLIELKNVSKQYRIFSKPIYKVIDALSLPVPKNAYQDFWALRGINLSVARGKKIGIVGRNGAGKSTLLKIIAGQITPTNGSIKVQGKIQALMELGTGFHPEFSGWDNMIAALGYMGMTGKEAQKEAAKITEFSELEEFIHNPLRTYSAGMYARLSFSVATTIKPEILIIDEILGAGDAYFSTKAYQRMRELTAGGTTVLFVSHDMSAVQQICDEAIWIERGQIIMRADTDTVAKAYADMVRKREELRLKARNSLMRVSTLENIRKSNNKPMQLIIRISRCEQDVFVNEAKLIINGQLYAGVIVGEVQDSALTEDAFVLLDGASSQWGKPEIDKSHIPFRRIPAKNNATAMLVFNLDGISTLDEIVVELRMRAGSCVVEAYDGKNYRQIAMLEKSHDWALSRCRIPTTVIGNFLSSLGYLSQSAKTLGSPETEDNTVANPDQGIVQNAPAIDYEICSGHILFDQVVIHGKEGIPQHIFNSFEPVWISIEYKTLKELYRPEFVVCFHRAGMIALQCLSRQMTPTPEYIPANTTGKIVFYMPELLLGSGNYLLSLGVFPEIDRNSLDTERTAFLLQDRRYELRVNQPEGGIIDFGIVRGHYEWEFTT